MPPRAHPPLIRFLYEALGTSVGLVVKTEDASLLRTKLYPLRKTDPALMCLALVLSPTAPKTELWVVLKPEVEIAES